MTMNIAEIIAMSVIRSFLNNSIKKFNEKDIKDSVAENRNLWEVTPDLLIKTGKTLKGRFGRYLDKYFEKITTDFLLNEWLSVDRPELCKAIKTTPGGYQWFDIQVKKIKYQILYGL
jgi:hypothetical protein